MNTSRMPIWCGSWLAALVLGHALLADEPAVPAPVQVKIEDGKVVAADVGFAIDPAGYGQVNAGPNMSYTAVVDNNTLQNAAVWSWFQVDGALTYPGNSGVEKAVNQPLPKRGGRARNGYTSTWHIGSLVVTQEIEVVATRGKGAAPRRRDAVLVTYRVENTGKHKQNLGLRVHTDPVVDGTNAVVFAAATYPNKLLDGVVLEGAKVPAHLEILQRPNLKNPGAVNHVTCDLGSGYERPGRLMLTRSGSVQGNLWDANIAPAGGATGLVLYWDPRDIQPGGVRKMAYAFGRGIAVPPEGEGAFAVALSGSFAPGKLFTITAQVRDPAPGQTLTLELPRGMQRIEGKVRQTVPPLDDDGMTLVLWKGRVLETGRFDVRVRSSTGVTLSKIVTITRQAGR